MKKLFILTLLAVLAFSAKTFAQSSWDQPYDGATHTYTVTGLTDGLDYEFFVATTATDPATITPLASGTYGTMNQATGVVSGGQAQVNITWAADASSNYGVSGSVSNGVYVFVKIYDADNSETPAVCENYMAVKVVPQPNAFSVVLADETGTQCPSTASADGFQPVFNDGNTYDAGTTTFVYSVTRQNATNNWSFNFSITPNADAGNFTYTVNGASSAITGDQTTSSGVDVSVPGATNSVTITVVAQNVQGKQATFNALINSAKDDVTSVTDLTVGVGDANSDVTHTINIMPTITGFSGN